MSDRAEQLHTTADEQVAELIALLSGADEDALNRPCPGREKLGDGSVGAIAAHTAMNYERIGAFVLTSQGAFGRHDDRQQRRHAIPGFRRALGHVRLAHEPPAGVPHEDAFTAGNTDPIEVVERLTAARADLRRIAELTDNQLDRIPPKDSFRFCDGKRTFEQVLIGLLKHQDHQGQALGAALTRTP